MQRGEMRNFIRKVMRIEAHDVDNADMDMFLDEGFDRIIAYTLWPFMYADSPETATSVSGQYEYVIDPKVKQIYAIINRDQRYQLRSMSASQVQQWEGSTISSSRPSHFFFREGLIKLFPTPASSSDKFEIYYIEQPTFAAGDSAEPPWNTMFHYPIMDWAMHRLWEMEEDLEISEQYRMRYEEGVSRMAEWYNDEMQDTPSVYGQRNAAWRPTNMPFLDNAVPI